MGDGSVSFLVCKNCNSVYELQPDESADDFKECQCGGDLEYSSSLDGLKSAKSGLKFALIWGIAGGVISSFLLRMIVLGALIGGFIAAYRYGGTFKDGLKSGFITGAIIMLLINLMVLIWGFIKNQDNYGISGINVHGPEMTIIFIIITMFAGGIIAAFTGLIGVKIKSAISK